MRSPCSATMRSKGSRESGVVKAKTARRREPPGGRCRKQHLESKFIIAHVDFKSKGKFYEAICWLGGESL